MTVSERLVGDIVVLDVIGPLTEEGNDGRLTAHVRRRLDAGHRQFVLNLRDVSACDQRGLDALIASLTLVEGRGGSLVMTDVQPCLPQLLKQTGLLAHVQTCDADAAALLKLRHRA